MEPQTVLFPAVRTTGLAERRGTRREPGTRSRIAAAVGVFVVGTAAMSTAVFQTVVASSTSLPMHEPVSGPVAGPVSGPVLAAPPTPPRAPAGEDDLAGR